MLSPGVEFCDLSYLKWIIVTSPTWKKLHESYSIFKPTSGIHPSALHLPRYK